MNIFLKIKGKLYNYLRHGSLFGLIAYCIAGFVYWLMKARRLYIGTRVVEIPWTLLYIRSLSIPSRVLQFGDVLLNGKDMQKHTVWVVDMDAEEVSHNNMHVDKKDIRLVSIPKNFFEIAISISTIEHIGLWGSKFDNGDRIAIEILHKALVSDGQLLFTIPFGEYLVADEFRIYDSKKLMELLDGLFEIICAEYILWNGWRWVSVPPSVAEKMYFMKHNENMNCGAAMIIAKKI